MKASLNCEDFEELKKTLLGYPEERVLLAETHQVQNPMWECFCNV